MSSETEKFENTACALEEENNRLMDEYNQLLVVLAKAKGDCDEFRMKCLYRVRKSFYTS